MVQATTGWNCDVERGPDCLFVRPRGSVSRADEAGLADQVWDLLERSSTHRLVLELDDMGLLKSTLVGQLLLLKQRIENRGGLMRLCGLSPANQRVLAHCRLDHFLPQYCDRTEAVMAGARPLQPR
jgi:anti-anti-sigma factor